MPWPKIPFMLICLRQLELERPIAPSIVFSCVDCKELVWRSKLAVREDPPGDIVCVACGLARAERLKAEGKAPANAVIDENVGVALAFHQEPGLARARIRARSVEDPPHGKRS